MNRSAWPVQFFILDSSGIFLKKQHVSGNCSLGGEVVYTDADAHAAE